MDDSKLSVFDDVLMEMRRRVKWGGKCESK